jgi:flotillin
MDISISGITPGSIIIAVIIILAIAVIASGYVKAPTDRAYIISGLKKRPRVLIGRAGVKIPFLERKDEMMLKQISIDIKTNGYIPTMDFIGVDIDAVAKVRVLTAKDLSMTNEAGEKIITETMVEAAMKNFLNMGEDGIRDSLTDSLQGNMREIIGTQDLRSLCNDRKKFGDEVQAKAQKDMNALGIWIESCNIQKIEDEKGLITALGQDNMSQIQKDASIAKAAAERDIAIAEAEAKSAANKADVESRTVIAERNNQLEIKQAELQRDADTRRAEADAAYKIQEQAQRRIIEVASTDADIARQEREIELKQKEAAVKEQELDAAVKKQADADRYKIQQEADAALYRRQKEAEAKKFEEAQAAEAQKIKAEAVRYQKEQDALAVKAAGEAEAAAIRAKGEAEAEALRAKGIAEAEAIDKKAEAMKKYGKAAVLELVVNKLPEMAEAVAKPLNSIDKVTIIDGGGSGSGVESMGGYVPAVMAKTMESVKEATGVDIAEIVKAQTYDAKVNRNVNISGVSGMAGTEAPVQDHPYAAETVIPDAADGMDAASTAEGTQE